MNWGEILVAAGVGALATGIVAFMFSRFSTQLDRRVTLDEKTEGKIERVDSTAREAITRVEKELGAKFNDLDKRLAGLDATVKHLPTGDEMRRLTDRLAQVEREVSGVSATLDGNTEMVRTIRDHIMDKEVA